MGKDRQPTVTAHTGCDGTAENSVESARRGLGLGADLAEVDVRADPDGRMYLWHDDELPLATGGKAPLEPLRVEEIRAMDRAGKVRHRTEGGRFATFEELAEAVRPTAGLLNLDLKNERCIGRIGAALRAAGLEGRAVVTGAEADWAAKMRKQEPHVPTYLNTSFGRTPPDALSRERITEDCRLAAGLGCRGLNIYHRYCSAVLVEEARRFGLEVSVWTVGPEAGFGRFLDLGVDNITTRHVAELLRFLGRVPGAQRS